MKISATVLNERYVSTGTLTATEQTTLFSGPHNVMVQYVQYMQHITAQSLNAILSSEWLSASSLSHSSLISTVFPLGWSDTFPY